MNLTISCKALQKNYGAKKVLKGIDLEIPAGTVVALLGTNGAGKTTLIRTILGLIPKTKGEIRVLGEEPYKLGALLRQRIGYVSEEQGLYGWMSVHEIVDFCKSLYPVWDQKLVDTYLLRFKINPKTKIQALSKGQQVKLALLLALAPKPELLILDEPMSGLDPLAQHEFLQVIMNEKKAGRTIFFSTHNLGDAMAVADQVAIVYDGKIQAYGSIAAICATITKITTDLQFSPDANTRHVLLSENATAKTFLIAAEAFGEIAAASETPLDQPTPPSVTLAEAFLFYCAGGE